MRPEPIVLLGALIAACGSNGEPTISTTRINPNLPSEDPGTYPVPDVPPPAVRAMSADASAPGDAEAGDAGAD